MQNPNNTVAMKKPLQELKLALPGRCSSLVTTRESGGLQFKYRWDCSCHATGVDDKALRVTACADHRTLLARTTFSASSAAS